MSIKMDVPVTVKHTTPGKSEKHPYLAEQELIEKKINDRGMLMDELYSRICATLGLPIFKTFSKSIEWDDGIAPIWNNSYIRKSVSADARSFLKKKIQFNPSVGQYLTQRDIDSILDSIDNFLNRNTKGTADEILIDTASASRILANMTEESSFDETKGKGLGSIRYKKNDYNSIRKQYSKFFIPRKEDNIRKRVIGSYITGINDDTRNSISKIISQGEISGKTNSEISQALFDQFGSLNKDWQRIADTEITNLFDEEYTAEQVSWAGPGEKVYFKRVEFPGGNICDFCSQAVSGDIIALYTENSMGDDRINDPVASVAIWPGKSNVGRRSADWWWAMGSQHPNCRGYWERYYPEGK